MLEDTICIKLRTERDSFYLWLEIGVQQDISIWIDGEVVSVWTNLNPEKEQSVVFFLNVMTTT